MNWDDARIFLAVARQGQILGAAKALGLNHATVARRLSTLEDALGSTLFHRRTNGTDLTAAGERFLIHAEAMESASLAASAMAGADSAIEGTVRVGAPDGFGVAFLAPRLGALTLQHPSLKIELVPVPRAFSLSKREADIAVTLERPREGRLIARKLTDYTLGLYASRAYLARHGAPADLAGLRDHSLIGYVDDLIYASTLDYTAEFSKDWRSSLSISSAMGQREAVRAGAGIGILHAFMARGDADLVAVLPQHVVRRAYWTVVHEDLRALRRVALVSDFLADIVQRDRAIF
ncbi:LysR family transcriptional regulator [Ketogulonicigenium vulgare]|uniref:LysR family transcriptional regulator n=1 Tax=Ketogulonicigenium vulgare (strain WSH-001) TaxID=759362 RepID=F9Y5L8_KETVW|nr:LysR family transcriptional regulator [Ketogulonicigenium vulgare]AEM40771.1 LysR family transcriptional regulator [Ketogulonicigenium vulgare WSH-001]ALJ80938.1 LysR family transcriptional regulator [Ketogulonicigenium vulgare]ANW33708.1 LysR family transcriptional regulator [Ketogulonicigenium vulgare]AOZ54489.1 LysR family transcriptional regulator [Ketogulonicigenium vulgare]